MTLSVDLRELEAFGESFVITLNDGVPEVIDEQLRGIGDKFVTIERQIIDEVSFEGELRDSVGYDVIGDYEVEIGPNIPSGDVEEGKIWGVWKGAKTRWVPLKRLQAWAATKPGVNPYSVWLRIAGVLPGRDGGTSVWQEAKRGTKAFPFPEETLASPEADAVLEEATNKATDEIIKRIVDGIQ